MNEIEKYYNEIAEYEWQRLERHKVEFDLTKRYLHEYICQPSSILDVGGGPGRYSIFLANEGHTVTMFELAANNIQIAKTRAENAGVKIKEFIQGNALNLSELVTGTFDVVLCMGPLYHLTEEADRRKVMQQCMELLKPGGLLVASFISAYAPIIDCIKGYPEEVVKMKNNLLKFLQDGRNLVAPDNSGFTTAYFINPMEIEGFMGSFGLEKLVITAVEGIPAQSEPKINALPEDAYQAWLDIIYHTSTNPMTWSTSEHFLYIGKK